MVYFMRQAEILAPAQQDMRIDVTSTAKH